MEQEYNVSDYGGFMLSKNVMNGRRIRYTYREKSQIPVLNGWTIYSDIDDDEYVSDPDNFIIVGVNTIKNIDVLLIMIFDAPYGTDICWLYDKEGRVVDFYDLKKDRVVPRDEVLSWMGYDELCKEYGHDPDAEETENEESEGVDSGEISGGDQV